MRHLVVVNLLLNKSNQEKGVTLLEVVLVSVIIGIMAAMSVPNLLEEQRQQKVNEAFSKVRGALVEAQTNANRQSTDCTVKLTKSGASGNPAGCVLEPFSVDTDIVSITKTDFSTTPTDITFSFTGTTGNTDTLWIARKDFGGNVIESSAKCIVVSTLGMIRTGINEGGNCVNVENKRYTP